MEQHYTRKSATEWEWQQGRKTYSVRYFPATGRLIWSGWMQTSEGVVFDEGIAQTADAFLAEGTAHIEKHELPVALLDELRNVLNQAQKSDQAQLNLFKRLFRRGTS